MSLADRFAAMAGAHPRCCWLDGGGARGWSGGRSLLAWLDHDDVSLTYDAARGEVVRHAAGRAEVVGDDVFAALTAELEAGSPRDSWFGYLGYACRPDLPAQVAPAGPGRVPDAVWMRPSSVRLADHPPPGPAGAADPARPAAPAGVAGGLAGGLDGEGGEEGGEEVPAAYADRFARVQERLRAGDSYEVNLTHRLHVDAEIDPVAAYLRLRALNPAPYAGFLQHDVGGAGDGHRAWLLSSSPERYALVARDDGGDERWLETKPIKGTAPRGATGAEDAAARDGLATDEKTRAENLMVTDLLRHDVALVSEPGTVSVPELMAVESYASVHQLVSTVRGRLRPEVGTVEALRALFPAGSMTGAPKRRTMEVIADVEPDPRGPYAGAFGWVSADGRADLGVVIRTLTTAGDGRWQIGTGGGVTVRSTVAGEYAESRWKAERLLRVLAR